MELVFKKTPWDHQKKAVEKALGVKFMAFFMEMGTGKTKTTIDTIVNLPNNPRVLIITPIITLENWKIEILENTDCSKDDIAVFIGSKEKKLSILRDAIDRQKKFLIVNYDALIGEAVAKLLHEYDANVLVCDESHLVKNYKSKRSKVVEKISQKCSYKYILTGTPILNDLSDLWMQFKILDGGKLLGSNFFVFRNKYMVDKNANWRGFKTFPKWVNRPGAEEEINKLISPYCIKIKKDECLDLPPLVVKTQEFEMGEEQKFHYERMLKDFITFINDSASVATTAMTKSLRLMQIASGFMKLDTGEEIDFKENPRLDICKELLSEIIINNKCIVWCSFIHNYKQLSRMCDELKLDYVLVTGGMSTEAKNDAVKRFNHEPSCKVMIANRAAAGVGINLVAASYSIVYSRNFSLGEEKQSEARNHRGGSEIHEKITKIDLCAKNSIDSHVLTALRNKEDIANKIMEFSKEFLHVLKDLRNKEDITNKTMEFSKEVANEYETRGC